MITFQVETRYLMKIDMLVVWRLIQHTHHESHI